MIGRVFVLLGLLLAPAVEAEEGESFSRFRLLTNTGERIQGMDARLTADTIEARKTDGSPITFSRDQLRALDVSKGTNAGRGAAIGASIGLITGLLAILQVGMDETRELKEGAAAGVTIGLTVGGGLIGTAVGASRPRWESIPLRTARTSSPENLCMVQLVRLRF